MRVAVIGAGSWGTTIAALASTNSSVVLWARRPELADRINADRINHEYLPEYPLPQSLVATSEMDLALAGADLVVAGVPSHGYRTVLGKARTLIASNTPVISLTKGIEAESGLRMSQVTLQVLANHDPSVVGVLSGPNLASEIMEGQPAATVIAMENQELSRRIQSVFTTPRFRVYTNADVIGVELAGATKNVIAIAAGVATGLGFGMNTLATLVTRGLAEMTRLGIAVGGETFTFGGLAGVGDLMATCGSPRSRNNRVGFQLGKGRRIEEILAETNMVAEGVRTTKAVLDLAAGHGVEMPIAESVGRILYEGQTVQEALAGLMSRRPKSEDHGMVF